MKKRKFLICIMPVIILALGYFLGAFYFQGKYLPNTYLNGEKITGKSVESINGNLKRLSDEKTFSYILENGSTRTFYLSEIDYLYSYDTPVESILDEQTEFAWIVSLFKKSNYEIPYSSTYDADKLYALVNNMDCFTQNIVEPTNARIEKTSTGFEIVDEVNGNTPKIDIIEKLTAQKINDGVFVLDLKAENCYEMPGVTSRDEELNEMLNELLSYKPFTLNLVDAEEKITYENIYEWVSYEDGIVKINTEAIENYVAKLAAKYDTLKRSRTFNTTYDGQIEIGGSEKDTYGFQINQGETVNAIINNLKNDEDIDVVWTEKAECRTELNDIGDTYVEISKDRQHLWVYVDGEMVLDTDVVTGNEGLGRGTTRGVFKVLGMSTDTYLVGPDYKTFVSYWMPITYTGTGMHDATWRSSFGGNIYKWDGSHGCINCPLSKAKTLYNTVYVGMPVIVY